MNEPSPSTARPSRLALWVPIGVLVLAAVVFVEVVRLGRGDFWDYGFLLGVAVLCAERIYRHRKA